jgi:hypothetical protein
MAKAVRRPVPFATPLSSRSAQDPHYQRERRVKGKAISKGMAKAKAQREEDSSIASSVVMPVKPASSPYPKKKAPEGVRRAISKADFGQKKSAK